MSLLNNVQNLKFKNMDKDLKIGKTPDNCEVVAKDGTNVDFMPFVQVVKVISQSYLIEDFQGKMPYREVYTTTFTTCTFGNDGELRCGKK